MLTLKPFLLLGIFACLSLETIGLVIPSSATAQSIVGASQPPPATNAQRPHLSVDPATGNDATADGSARAPFRTLTRALQVAAAGTIVMLAPGVYSSATGEVFPLLLQPSVTLRGNRETRGQGIVIQGGGVFLSPTSGRQNVAVVAADQATLVGVTVSNPEPGGLGLWVESASLSVTDSTFKDSRTVGIAIVGSSAALIQNNYFEQNGENGLLIAGQAHPQVWENIFESTGTAIVLRQSATPKIVGNRITQNQTGVVLQDNAQPTLRNNSIEGNSHAGLVAMAEARPDLGTLAEPGGNVFRNNGQLDIDAKSQEIVAVGNQIGKVAGQVNQAGRSRTLPRAASPLPLDSPRPDEATTGLSQTASSNPASSGPAPVSNSSVSADSFPTPTLSPTSALTSSEEPPAPVVPIPPPPRISSALPRPLLLSVVRSQPIPSPAPTAAPISIPVPPPDRSSPVVALVSPAPAVAPRPLVVAEAPQPRAIAIPVPPPESRTIAPVATAPDPPRVALSTVQTGAHPPASKPSGIALLPVPSGTIPIGNVGTGSGVPLYRSAPTAALPPAATTLRYRVVAETKDNRQQAQVRTLVPGAFWTTLKGRSVMQLGAFGDRSKANELVQALKDRGVAAAIEAIE